MPHGSAIFFVTNNHKGNIIINDSIIRKKQRRLLVRAARHLDARRHQDRDQQLHFGAVNQGGRATLEILPLGVFFELPQCVQ